MAINASRATIEGIQVADCGWRRVRASEAGGLTDWSLLVTLIGPAVGMLGGGGLAILLGLRSPFVIIPLVFGSAIAVPVLGYVALRRLPLQDFRHRRRTWALVGVGVGAIVVTTWLAGGVWTRSGSMALPPGDVFGVGFLVVVALVFLGMGLAPKQP